MMLTLVQTSFRTHTGENVAFLHCPSSSLPDIQSQPNVNGTTKFLGAKEVGRLERVDITMRQKRANKNA